MGCRGFIRNYDSCTAGYTWRNKFNFSKLFYSYNFFRRLFSWMLVRLGQTHLPERLLAERTERPYWWKSKSYNILGHVLPILTYVVRFERKQHTNIHFLYCSGEVVHAHVLKASGEIAVHLHSFLISAIFVGTFSASRTGRLTRGN
jgi:hypothetical protein